MDRCNIFGTLPNVIGAFVNITAFHVQGNRLCGTLPASMSNWDKITSFQVDGNMLTGSLPAMSFALITGNNADDNTGCTLSDSAEYKKYQDTNTFTCPWPAGATAACSIPVYDSKPRPITDADCVATTRASMCPTPSPTPAPTPPTPLPTPVPPTPSPTPEPSSSSEFPVAIVAGSSAVVLGVASALAIRKRKAGAKPPAPKAVEMAQVADPANAL